MNKRRVPQQSNLHVIESASEREENGSSELQLRRSRSEIQPAQHIEPEMEDLTRFSSKIPDIPDELNS